MSVSTASVSVLGIPVRVLRVEHTDANSTANVLLLHGQAFSSATWMELGTIQHLAAMGYAVAAVDLPGFGKTPAKAGLDKVMESAVFHAHMSIYKLSSEAEYPAHVYSCE